MKALIVGPYKEDPIGWWQIYPFHYHKRELKKRIGFQFTQKKAGSVDEIKSILAAKHDADVFFVRPEWNSDPSEVLDLFIRLKDKYPNKKIFLIDPFDQSSSRFFPALPYLDGLIKYLPVRDKNLYLKDFKGGSYQTHKLDELGYDLKGWHVGSKVPKGHQNKIFSGWFVIRPDIISNVLSPWSNIFHAKKKKDIDIFCHLSCGERNNLEWYGEYRRNCIDKLEALNGKFNISVNADYIGEPRISRKEYINSTKRSKIIFSPLGWGEVSMRLFEAISDGSLYIQPEVPHLEIQPNVLQEYKTFVPIKWDLTDMIEKIEYYLSNPEESQLIIENAALEFKQYFREHRFINILENILNQ